MKDSQMCLANCRIVAHVHLSVCIFLFATMCLFQHEPLDAQDISDSRTPIPSFAKQTKATELLEQIQSIKSLDTVARKKVGLKKLMPLARSGSLATEELYVILTKSIPLARDVDDIPVLVEALQMLTTTFAVDGLQEQAQVWSSYFETSSSKTSFKPAMEASIEVARQALQKNRYSEANSLLKSAETAAVRLEVSIALKQIIVKERAALTDREKAWNVHQSASEKLKSDPKDPAASMISGRWYALREDDWGRALPLLTNVNDAKWKKAAELELEAPTDPAKQQTVADTWWDLAGTETGSAKTKLMLHSEEWYEKAIASVTSPLKKEALSRRLAEISALKPTSAVSTASSGKKGEAASKATVIQKQGEWVDLLVWTEGMNWSQHGYNWNDNLASPPTKAGISLKPVPAGRFPIPAIIDGNYEMELEFTRQSGNQGITVFFPIGMHNLQLEIGTDGGTGALVAHVNGKRYGERSSLPINKDERQRLLIQVQRDGDKAAFRIDWNSEKDFISWTGKYSDLTNFLSTQVWKLTMVRRPWIGADMCQMTFHRIQVRMQSGMIRPDVITESDVAADLKNGLVRLVGQKAKSSKVGWSEFLINQLPIEYTRGFEERQWPLVGLHPTFCQDFYGAHAPSQLKCPISKGAKSFSTYGYNDASRSTRFMVLVDGKELYDSGTTDIAQVNLSLPTSASLLELVVDPVDTASYDQSYWCYPRFHSLPVERLTDKQREDKLPPSAMRFSVSASSAGASELTHNQPIASLNAIPLSLGDRVPCDEFLFCHAPASVSYSVPDGMTRFTAVGYNILSQGVKFEVWADNQKIYESPPAGIIPIDVKLPRGTKSIELRTNELGDSNADNSMWCFPRLLRR